MGLFDPAWMKDNEEAAIRAIQKERKDGKLIQAASFALSYRVRAIANEKLGRVQGAKYEIAVHDPDEAVCLAALDEVDWTGWDQLLGTIALSARKEAVSLKALSKVQDDQVLADVAARSENEVVANRALGLIRDADALAGAIAKLPDERALGVLDNVGSTDILKRVCEAGPDALQAPLRFEIGKRLGDAKVCAEAFDGLLAQGANRVMAALKTLEDEGFLKEVVGHWLETSENPTEVSKKFGRLTIVGPSVARELEDFFCPEGCLHQIDGTSMGIGADTDERIGIISCKNCGYRYRVSHSVYLWGKNGGYKWLPDSKFAWLMKDREVVCRPAGWICTKCRTAVQPEGDSPAPCICPTCGTESHNWEHVNGESVHRDYSSGTSYDQCKRCGKKDNFINHGSW